MSAAPSSLTSPTVWLTLAEAAQRARVHRNTVRRAMRQGRLPLSPEQPEGVSLPATRRGRVAQRLTGCADGAAMSVKTAAEDYIDRGWSPVPVCHHEKAPRHPDWTTRTFAAADFQDDDNIGLHLGKGLYDWDLDCPEAVIAADVILHTSSIFGRPSKQGSHRLFASNDTIPLTQYHALDGKMIVELRVLV